MLSLSLIFLMNWGLKETPIEVSQKVASIWLQIGIEEPLCLDMKGLKGIYDCSSILWVIEENTLLGYRLYMAVLSCLYLSRFKNLFPRNQ